MPLRVRLNGNLITDDVYGLDNIEENYFYQPEIFTYLHEITGSIVFTGGSFALIRELLIGDICDSILIKIEDDSCGQYEDVYDGEINLTDVKWNLTQCTATVTISDRGIIGLIDDNKSVPVNLYVPSQKNGGGLPPVPQVLNIGFVDPTSSVAVITGRRGILVFEALLRIVNAISDNQISVRSNYFDPSVGNPLEAQKNCVLMAGKELRLGTGIAEITINYEDLIRDLNKLYCISVAFEIDSVSRERFLRIEPRAYFFQENPNGYLYREVNDVEQSVEEDIFYAMMDFGSFEASEIFEYIEKLSFLSHEKQRYHLGGQCNIDNTLDLVTATLIYDTNVIQRVLPVLVSGHDDDGYDDDVFIIHIFDAIPPAPHSFYGRLTALPYNPLEGYYNATFSPYSISQRWFGNVPFSIYQYLGGTGSEDAAAVNLNPQNTQLGGSYPPSLGVQYQWIDFPSTISDPSGNFHHAVIPDPAGYTGSISYYEAPVGGIYAVNLSLCIRWGFWQYVQFLVITPAGGIEYYIQPFNVFEGGTPQDPYGAGIVGIQPVWVENYCLQTSAIIPMQAGHRLCALLPYAMGIITDAEISVKSTFSGEFQNYDFNTVKYLRTKFEFPLPLGDRNTILSAPYGKQRMTFNNGSADGYLNNLKRNIESGKSSVEWLGSF